MRNSDYCYSDSEVDNHKVEENRNEEGQEENIGTLKQKVKSLVERVQALEQVAIELQANVNTSDINDFAIIATENASAVATKVATRIAEATIVEPKESCEAEKRKWRMEWLDYLEKMSHCFDGLPSDEHLEQPAKSRASNDNDDLPRKITKRGIDFQKEATSPKAAGSSSQPRPVNSQLLKEKAKTSKDDFKRKYWF